MGFTDKIAIVTGAGQGIGEVYATALADEGAKVVVADLNDAQAERVAKAIEAAGGTALAVKVDVADPQSALDMAEAAKEAFGGIDYLVNNAAIYGAMEIDSLMNVDLAYYRRFMSVNMDGALHCTRAVHTSMIERGGGAIVNQSSTAGWMAGGYYGIAKTALNALTISMASELGWQGIRVNAIAPGPTDTEATRKIVPDEFMESMIQGLMLKRMGTPQDHVGLLKFLLSDEAAWVTAQIIAVDGGQMVRL